MFDQMRSFVLFIGDDDYPQAQFAPMMNCKSAGQFLEQFIAGLPRELTMSGRDLYLPPLRSRYAHAEPSNDVGAASSRAASSRAMKLLLRCWHSSGVERVLGKDEVLGSIPSASCFAE